MWREARMLLWARASRIAGVLGWWWCLLCFPPAVVVRMGDVADAPDGAGGHRFGDARADGDVAWEGGRWGRPAIAHHEGEGLRWRPFCHEVVGAFIGEDDR